MSISTAPIKTPLSRLFMIWRRRFMPLAVWLIAVGVAYMLVQRQQVFVDAVGIVEAHTTFVAPLFDGTVKSLEVDLLDDVAAGDVVATMDDVLIRSELNVAEMELDRVRALLDAEIARFNQEQQVQQVAVQSDSRSFLLNEEQARLDHLDRVSAHETDKIELERLSVELGRQKSMLEQSLIDNASYDVTRLAHEGLRVKIEKDRIAIAMAEQNIATASARREVLDGAEVPPSPVDAVLHALQADIVAQEAIVAEVKSRQEALALRRPQVTIEAPRDLTRYIIEKGSIALDGISLTVVEVHPTDQTFSVHIIPHTWSETALSSLSAGMRVNLETDMIGKYVRSVLPGLAAPPLTWDRLREAGFLA